MNLAYAFVAFSLSAWTLCTYFYNNPIIFEPIIWLKIIYIVSYFMLISQCIFVYVFPRRISEKFWPYLSIILITFFPSAYFLLFTNDVVVLVVNYREISTSIAQMGGAYLFYTLPNVLGTLLLSIYFLKKSKWFSGHEKAQIHIYIAGIVL